MKIRFAAVAALGVLVGLAGCGSEARDSASSVSAPRPTTTSVAPSTTSSEPTAYSAAAADEPEGGRLTPTAPAQTLTTLPEDSFTVTFGGVSYYCEPQGFLNDERSDCVRYSGGAAPYVGSPELYCSYSARPECSKDWYPAELDDADMVTMNGQTYVCRNAVLGRAYDDRDCAPYSGGDPDRTYGMALKCSSTSGGLQCDDKYYPSEMKGLTQVQIGYDDYLCKSTYSGQECWEWSGIGSPKMATIGLPDLYCNSSGTCSEDGYPSRY